jgi:hypothetical protein
MNSIKALHLTAAASSRFKVQPLSSGPGTMMKKADYKRALQVVGSVVRKWDPYSLIAGGSPEDEFDSEIASVVAQIPRTKTEKEATLTLSRVFSAAFESDRFTPDKCREAGKRLFADLSANGFVRISR